MLEDFREEQSNEIEAIRSIYFEEFEEIAREPPEFSVRVSPEVDCTEDSGK